MRILENGDEAVPLEIIDIARYIAYEKYGLPEEKKELDLVEIADKIVEKIRDEPEFWFKLNYDQKVGFILSEEPKLKFSDAKKILRIIAYKLKRAGIDYDDGRTWITSNQAALILNVSTKTIHNYIKKGLLSAIKLPGGYYRLDLDSVLKLKKSMKSWKG